MESELLINQFTPCIQWGLCCLIVGFQVLRNNMGINWPFRNTWVHPSCLVNGRVAHSYVFCLLFCRPLFVFLSFFLMACVVCLSFWWPLCCLSFHLPFFLMAIVLSVLPFTLLDTSLVSSNSSQTLWIKVVSLFDDIVSMFLQVVTCN